MTASRMAHWLVFAAVGLAGCEAVGCRRPGKNAADADTRIGVYDSRAIAVAYCGSEYHDRDMEPLMKAYEKAKVEGDEKRTSELNAEFVALQEQLHRQGFSTAPVDNILDHVRDKLPDIAREASVGPIVSKWDKDTLARYKRARRVDITMPLVMAFNPGERQLKIAQDIQKRKPIPLGKLEKMIAAECR